MPNIFANSWKKGRDLTDSSRNSKHHATEQHGRSGDKRLGLFIVWPIDTNDGTPASPTDIDIVAVHGLGGHPYETWTDGGRMWLRDFLPSDVSNVRPRIMTFGYDSTVAFSRSVSRIDDFAITLLGKLQEKRYRNGTSKNPIIFVCHSLGGIVFKKALVIAHERQSQYSELSSSITGVIFMGTPHRGSDAASWGSILTSWCDLLLAGSVRRGLLKDLETHSHSKTLDQIGDQFVERGAKLGIITLYERKKLKGLKLIVDKHSAILGIPNELPYPIEADHVQMCKFRTRSDHIYETVSHHISTLANTSQEGADKFREARQNFLQNILHDLDFEPHVDEPRLSPGGYFQWIWTDDGYRTWNKDPFYRVLWIHGPPGSGKSSLMQKLSFELGQQISSQSQSNIARFFCSAKGDVYMTARDLLRVILFQFLDSNKSLFYHIPKDILHRRRLDISRDAKDELLCLQSIVGQARNNRFLILIDALDELEAEERHVLHQHLDDLLTADDGCRLRIILSDRQSPERLKALQYRKLASCIELTGKDIAADVGCFLESSVNGWASQNCIPRDLEKKTLSKLIEVANGNFLVANLAWTNFNAETRSWTRTKVLQKLSTLRQTAPTMESHYCGLLRRIPAELQRQARTVFDFLLESSIPLTVDDLKTATAIELGTSTSLAAVKHNLPYNFITENPEHTAYLLEVGEHGFVKFYHQSVAELLRAERHEPQNDEILGFFKSSRLERNKRIGHICLTILQYEDFQPDRVGRILLPTNQLLQYRSHEIWTAQRQRLLRTFERRMHRIPLLAYSIDRWFHHCQIADKDQELVARICQYATNWVCNYFSISPGGECWWNANVLEDPAPPTHQLLQHGDFPECISHLVNINWDPNFLYDTHTPLSRAAARHRWDSFKFLLSVDDVNPNLPIDGNKAIHYCVQHSNQQALEQLVNDDRIDINAKNPEGNTALLQCAVFRVGLQFVRVILSHPDVNVNIKNNSGQSPFCVAFHYPNGEKIAKELMEHPELRFESVPDIFDVFTCADMWGWHDIEDELVRRFPDKVVQSMPAQPSVLEWYAFFGRKAKVQWLLHCLPATALKNYTASEGHSLVHLCGKHDWEDMFDFLRGKFLLSTTGVDHCGRTVLHYAVEHGWKLVLANFGAREISWINHQDRDGLTALHLAVESRNIAAVQNLLAHGASYKIHDKRGRTAVHLAAENNTRNIMNLFLQTPTHNFGVDNEMRSLLHYLAMWTGSGRINSFIVSRNANVNVLDQNRRTPLHYAAIFANDAGVFTLLEHGSSVNNRDANGWTAVHYAIRNGNRYMVELLLKHGADLDMLNGFGQSCLQLALVSGSADTTNLLLSQNPRLDHRDNFERTPLHLACLEVSYRLVGTERAEHERNGLETIKYLLRAGADVNSTDSFGRTALHIAAAKCDPQLVRLLLKRPDTRVSPRDRHGCTPLDWAVSCRNQATVKLLRRKGARCLADARGQAYLQSINGVYFEHYDGRDGIGVDEDTGANDMALVIYCPPRDKTRRTFRAARRDR